MKKLMICILGACVAASSFAKKAKEDPNEVITLDGQKITVGELNKLMEDIDLERTGGTIRKANSAKGVFVVLNAQTNVATSAFRTDVEEGIDEHVYVQMAFKSTAAAVDCRNAKAEIRRAGGVLGVVVVNDPGLPALVTAPEDGWSLVNVAALAVGNPKPDILASRVAKEVMRGFAFVSGGAYLSRAPYVMRDVKNPHNLDMIPDTAFGIEVALRIRESAGFYGLIPWRQATYLEACQQGWAPAPTNKYQKAIWDKVHEIPSQPIKIKYDKKTAK